jgi:hypothetical protein
MAGLESRIHIYRGLCDCLGIGPNTRDLAASVAALPQEQVQAVRRRRRSLIVETGRLPGRNPHASFHTRKQDRGDVGLGPPASRACQPDLLAVVGASAWTRMRGGVRAVAFVGGLEFDAAAGRAEEVGAVDVLGAVLC